MLEVIVFPDAEALVVGYLNDNLTYPASTRVDASRPARFCQVIRTGGPRSTMVTDGAQLTFLSWSTDETEAAADAQQVRAFVNALPGEQLDGHTVYRVEEFSGPSFDPDPDTGRPRYKHTARIHIRGAAA